MQTIILLWVTFRTDWKKEASSFELIIFFYFLFWFSYPYLMKPDDALKMHVGLRN